MGTNDSVGSYSTRWAGGRWEFTNSCSSNTTASIAKPQRQLVRSAVYRCIVVVINTVSHTSCPSLLCSHITSPGETKTQDQQETRRQRKHLGLDDLHRFPFSRLTGCFDERKDRTATGILRTRYYKGCFWHNHAQRLHVISG